MGKPKKPKKLRFTEEEARKLIDDLFNHFKNQIKIRESQYKEYFKKYKGLTEEDILQLELEACWEYGIINLGVGQYGDKTETVIWRPEDLGELPIKEVDEILKKIPRKKKKILK